jgi:hypothetical protein
MAAGCFFKLCIQIVVFLSSKKRIEAWGPAYRCEDTAVGPRRLILEKFLRNEIGIAIENKCNTNMFDSDFDSDFDPDRDTLETIMAYVYGIGREQTAESNRYLSGRPC